MQHGKDTDEQKQNRWFLFLRICSFCQAVFDKSIMLVFVTLLFNTRQERDMGMFRSAENLFLGIFIANLITDVGITLNTSKSIFAAYIRVVANILLNAVWTLRVWTFLNIFKNCILFFNPDDMCIEYNFFVKVMWFGSISMMISSYSSTALGIMEARSLYCMKKATRRNEQPTKKKEEKAS
jgi:hypothetical protein